MLILRNNTMPLKIRTGPKGGKYYIKKGKKIYIKQQSKNCSKCGGCNGVSFG